MTMDVYGHLFESPQDDVELFAKMENDLLAAYSKSLNVADGLGQSPSGTDHRKTRGVRRLRAHSGLVAASFSGDKLEPHVSDVLLDPQFKH